MPRWCAGVPLLLVVLIYPKREQIKKILTDIKEQDRKTHTVTTVTEVVASKRRQRASIVELSASVHWLVPKFEKFEPECWGYGAFALVLRLCQSSMMVMFDDQSIQAACASMIAQVGICAQRNLAPYRRASDNEIALYAQWLIFIWCSMLLLRVIGAVALLPTFLVGLFCLLPTVAVVARALHSARTDIVNEFQLLRRNSLSAVGVARRQTYQKGDFVLVDVKLRKDGDLVKAKEEHFTASAAEFCLRYAPIWGNAPGTVVPSGLQLCRSVGKIWALCISAEDARTHFPGGRFIASSGAEISVAPGDFLAMPFPYGLELSVVPKMDFDRKYSDAVIASAPVSNNGVPTQAQVLSVWLITLKTSGKLYRKSLKVNAKMAIENGVLENVIDGVVAARTSYTRGDFIAVGSKEKRYVIPALTFAAEYDRLRPAATSDEALAHEGFQSYSPRGRVLARELNDDDLRFYFPSGRFIDRWGGIVTVSAGDYLATPSPALDEVFAIPRSVFSVMYEPYTETDDVLTPSQSEALAYWEGVLQRESRVYCRATSVYAKRALEDGTIEDAPAIELDSQPTEEVAVEMACANTSKQTREEEA